MHYGSHGLARNKDVVVMTPTREGGDVMGQRDGVSDQDIMKIRLMYQCLSGPHDQSSYESDPCNPDCPCWEGATGCNGDSSACLESLTCSDNMCVADGSTGGTGTGGGCTDTSGWVDEYGDGCDW